MNSLLWKRFLGRLLNRRPTERRDVILIYHSVGGGPLSIPEAQFRQQMDWLKDNAHVATLDELLETHNPGELRVVLSFDDGYRSLHDVVHPILAFQGFPAVVYLNSGLLGEDRHISSSSDLGHYPDEQFMTWREADNLAKNGWTIGAHGMDHLDLTKTTTNQTYAQLVDCKAQIEEKLGIVCTHFAYTWGHYNPQVIAAVAKASFRSAVSCNHGPVTPASERYVLPRVDIRADYELCDFIDVVLGRWDYVWLKQRVGKWFV